MRRIFFQEHNQMACSPSEIVFWTVGGLILVVLIAIGIAEMCRKFGSSSSSSSCGSTGTVTEEIVIAPPPAEEIMQVDGVPAVRAGRVERLSSVTNELTPAVMDSATPQVDQLHDKHMTDAYYGASDGVAFDITPGITNKSNLRAKVTESGMTLNRDLTTSDTATRTSRSLSRHVGLQTNVALDIMRSQNCDGAESPSLIDVRAPIVQFNSTEAYVAARQHAAR